jgi:hypothetical protein
VHETELFRLQTSSRQGTEDLREPFGKVYEVENAAVTEKGGGGSNEVGESQGDLLAGKGPLGFGRNPASGGGTERRVRDHPLKTLFQEEAGSLSSISLKDGAPPLEAVAGDIFLCQAGEFRLYLDAPHFQGGPLSGEEQGDDSTPGADVDHLFPETGPDERGEKKGIQPVTVSPPGLSQDEAAYFFEAFSVTGPGRVRSGGGSISHNPRQYLPGGSWSSSGDGCFSWR